MHTSNTLNKFVYDQERSGPAVLKSKPTNGEDQILMELERFKTNVNMDKTAKGSHHTCIDQLYQREVSQLDKNLKDMGEFLKPQARQIYYQRKVEYISLVQSKKQDDVYKRKHILTTMKQREEAFQSDYDKQKNELINLMNKYDIKHPLRGPAWEDIKTDKLAFKEKIIGIVSTKDSYLGYKKDLRKTLETSKMLSDEALKQMEEEQNKIRTKMKYRLYGKDGVDKHEWAKLVQWGEVKKKKKGEINGEIVEPKTIRVKKRTSKLVLNEKKGKYENVSEEVSGSGSSKYSHKFEDDYVNNELGNPYTTNEGFTVKPLPKEIYGFQQHNKSVRKHNLLKEEKSKAAATLQENRVGDATFFNDQSETLINLPSLNTVKGPKKRNKFMDRNNSVQVAPLSRNTFNMASGSDYYDAQQNNLVSKASIPSSTIDLSFLPPQTRPNLVAKNLPVIRQPILKPYYAQNPEIIQSALNTHKGFKNIQIDQDSENDFLNDTIQNMDLPPVQKKMGMTIHIPTSDQNTPGDLTPASNYGGNSRVKFKKANMFGTLQKDQSGLSSIQQQTRSPRESHLQNLMLHNSTKTSFKTLRTTRNKSQVQKLEKVNALVKRDNRCNPGSPFRFNTNHVFNSNLERKQIGNGRLNRKLKGATSTLKDPDIRALLSQYPVEGRRESTEQDQTVDEEDEENKSANQGDMVYLKNTSINELHHDPTVQALKNKDKKQRNKMYRKAFENMIRNIDIMERAKKDQYEDLITKLVQQNIRDEELQKLVNYMKEVDYADPSRIIPLYDYKMADEQERIKIAQEVSREYREGKLDPHNTNMKLKKKHK